MKNFIFLFTSALFFTTCSVAQWTRITAVPAQEIRSLALLGDTILAAGGHLVFKSTDGGLNWDSIVVSNNPIVIFSMNVIDNKIYVGTASNGVFCSDDSGATWPNTGIGLSAISGFEKFGNDVYASTLGGGVYVFNQIGNNWLPFNDSLPSYSVNVFTILSTPNSLIIGPGSNGTFYRYDFILNYWHEEYYDGVLHPGIQINKLINNSDTIFAVNGNRVIRSEDDGMNWTNDTVGTHDGASRFIYSGSRKHYTITNLFSGGTWIQERSKGSSNGITWATNEEFLPTGISFDIHEFQNKLFLGRGDGLYTKSLVQEVGNPIINKSIVKIYPNPSNNSIFNISCERQIDKYIISSSSGKILFSEIIGKNEFTIHSQLTKGIYFIKLTLSNGQDVIEKIIVE